MTNAPHGHIIAYGLLLAACSGRDTEAVEKAPVTAALAATAQPLPVTAIAGSLTAATVSGSAGPVATSTMLPSAATLDPNPEQQHMGTAPPATSTATVMPTAQPTIIIDPTPTYTVTQLTDGLTDLPAFTLPEIGLTEATAYDPTGLLQMEVPFIPLDNPVQVSAATATWLRPDDFVLGVERGGEARAYPISQIEYHHIVNDTIAGEPYLVTY